LPRSDFKHFLNNNKIKILKKKRMVNAQQWLDEKYPKSRRSEITELDISKGKVKR